MHKLARDFLDRAKNISSLFCWTRAQKEPADQALVPTVGTDSI